jgi:hypothetical protein
MGAQLPLKVELRMNPSSFHADEQVTFEIAITNVSDAPLSIPISPNPGDFEPKDKQRSYTLQHLALFMTADPKGVEVLKGGADLYGDPQRANSIAVLALILQ